MRIPPANATGGPGTSGLVVDTVGTTTVAVITTIVTAAICANNSDPCTALGEASILAAHPRHNNPNTAAPITGMPIITSVCNPFDPSAANPNGGAVHNNNPHDTTTTNAPDTAGPTLASNATRRTALASGANNLTATITNPATTNPGPAPIVPSEYTFAAKSNIGSVLFDHFANNAIHTDTPAAAPNNNPHVTPNDHRRPNKHNATTITIKSTPATTTPPPVA
ncbi:hypothetical protein [Candidatus Poriferisocius sp.]|uniref:hypothetical protein n=1 Tax=Candidatus Poriferisocius sp. TaxID=3101276 RepID=UPI003B5AC457